MEKKEEKKGFWASLLSPTKKACHCQTIIEEVNDEVKSEKETSVEHEKEKAVKSCNCG